MVMFLQSKICPQKFWKLINSFCLWCKTSRETFLYKLHSFVGKCAPPTNTMYTSRQGAVTEQINYRVWGTIRWDSETVCEFVEQDGEVVIGEFVSRLVGLIDSEELRKSSNVNLFRVINYVNYFMTVFQTILQLITKFFCRQHFDLIWNMLWNGLEKLSINAKLWF